MYYLTISIRIVVSLIVIIIMIRQALLATLLGGSSIAITMALDESPDRMLYYCITNYYILLPCL